MDLFWETPLDGYNYTFGYFDRSQLSFDSTKLVCVRHSFTDVYPPGTSKFEIGFFDLADTHKQFQQISTTRCFNFQMGSNIFWHSDRDQILFNDFENGRYISKAVSLNTQLHEIVGEAVYACSKDLKRKVHIDFSRYDGIRRGYSYGCDNALTWDRSSEIAFYCSEPEGIHTEVFWRELFDEGVNKLHICYVEHFQFSPNGSKIAYLCRVKKSGMIDSRLMVFDWDSRTNYTLLKSGRASHFHWIDDENLILYGSVGNALTRARSGSETIRRIFKFVKPLYRLMVPDNSAASKTLTGDQYLLVSVDQGSVKTRPIFKEISSEDGHPSVFGNYVVTDTYSKRLSGHDGYLYMCNLAADNCELVLRISGSAHLDETPFRCDFHPRFSFDGRFVSIDRFFISGADISRGCSVYTIA